MNRRMADPVILFVRTRCSRTRSGHLSDVAPAPRRFDVTGTRLEPGGMHAALVPPSTAYPTPPLGWWHEEGCAVDRTQGFGCTCAKGATNAPPDTYLAKEESR